MRCALAFSLAFFVAAAALAADRIGSMAPDFAGKTFAGDSLCLSDYRGKVVLIDIWASWCGPCRKEMPFLVTLHGRYQKRGFAVIAVNIDDHLQNARKFLASLFRRPDFPILRDQEKLIPPLFEIKAMPTSIFIDRSGRIRFWHNGFKPSQKQKYIDELEQLLDEKKKRG